MKKKTVTVTAGRGREKPAPEHISEIPHVPAPAPPDGYAAGFAHLVNQTPPGHIAFSQIRPAAGPHAGKEMNILVAGPELRETIERIVCRVWEECGRPAPQPKGRRKRASSAH